MGTKSLIAIETNDRTFEAIYCHFDGYPDGVGKILLDHYQDPQKVKKLISLGDLSSLGPEIGEEHDFDDHDPAMCNFYGRDRGEDEVSATKSENMNELIEDAKNCFASYLYVFKQNNKWYWTVISRGMKKDKLKLLRAKDCQNNKTLERRER